MAHTLRTIVFVFTALVLIIGLSGCGTSTCASDGDCSGDGICVDGFCFTGRASPEPAAPLTPADPLPADGVCASSTGECRSVGLSAGVGFDLDRDPSGGVILDEDGVIVLDTEREENQVIWIANTGEGTVAKVDTRTYEELARYRVGPLGGESDDPSRTSVNTFGDVYVGNRAGGSVTKLSTLGTRCPDTNGDGVITTSSGADDVLPWGQDDCVLWNRPLPDGGLIRAVAAQDVTGPDLGVVPYLWIGGYDGVIWKLDGESGEVLLRTEAPVPPYGFALDRAGNLWMATREGNRLGRLDTNLCTTDESCGDAVCDDAGDDCLKQVIALPAHGYGVTVDFMQRVWLGGDHIMRYDPTAVLGDRIIDVDIGAMVHGIAADGDGWVWGAAMNAGVVRVDAVTPSRWAIIRGSEDRSAKGMAIDADGKVWTINQSHEDATVIEPGPSLLEAVVTPGVAGGLVSPYTYSDMTGQQLRLATHARGFYRRIFEGCAENIDTSSQWRELHWSGDAPPGTRLIFRVRSAATRAELVGARWITAAVVPPIVTRIDLAELFLRTSYAPGAVLEVEVQLERLPTAASEVVTPRVSRIEAGFVCIGNVI